MSLQSHALLSSFFALLLASTGFCHAARTVVPSDCLPRDADSTCAAAVARKTTTVANAAGLYDGPLGGVPASGYAYWGFDFDAAALGVASKVSQDMYINRSAYPVTITLTFTIPTTHACGSGCLPGVKFLRGTSWSSVFPAMTVSGGTATIGLQIAAGDSYGWVIGLWQATNPRITVTIPAGASATMEQLGLSVDMGTADEIAAVDTTCECWDSFIYACSAGTHFSNGLLGVWYQSTQNYLRAGAYSNCPVPR
jgi:hypothetical protein